MTFLLNDNIVTHRVSNAGFLPEEGQDHVRSLLRRYSIDIPDTWDWNWIAEKNRGTYVGSLTKRLAKLVYKTTTDDALHADSDYGYLQKVSLDSDAMGRLGSILGNYMTVGAADYHFRFVDKWHDGRGDFGENSGNCYFGMYRGSRTLLEHYGCKVLQFFADGSEYPRTSLDEEGRERFETGVGRAWLLPVRMTPTGRIKVGDRKAADLWVLCNGYGITTVEACRVLADYWGMTYRKSQVTNSPITEYYPWVNGTSGYLIGPTEQIHALHEMPSLKLNMPEGKFFRNEDSTMYELYSCAVCGIERMSYRLGDNIHDRPDHPGEHMCTDCMYYRRCVTCDYRVRIYPEIPRSWADREQCIDCYEEAIEAERIQTSLEEAEEAANEG